MIATTSIQTRKADQPESIQVTHANYLDGYRLAITFSDGKERIVDFSDFLSTCVSGYLAKYKNKSNFKRFRIDRGNVVWGEIGI
ncbi:MAG: DUF2442 domain-containing protein [Segetibacter sp.]